jgi:hypothetical protein
MDYFLRLINDALLTGGLLHTPDMRTLPFGQPFGFCLGFHFVNSMFFVGIL